MDYKILIDVENEKMKDGRRIRLIRSGSRLVIAGDKVFDGKVVRTFTMVLSQDNAKQLAQALLGAIDN